MSVVSPWRRLAYAAVALGALVLGGCEYSNVHPQMMAAVDAGHYSAARVDLQQRLTDNPSDRAYLLDRLRLLILTLADGYPQAAEEVSNQTFRLLRTQGLNADRTTAAVVLNEGVKIWKGEPFEQALAYSYIAMQKAELGEWDNARAAANASLFLLKSFGENERGEEMNSYELARRAAEEDARRGEGAGDRYINKGYTPVKTNFVLGYLLNGVANKAIGRDDEAADNFHEAEAIRDYLKPLAAALDTGKYNTVFVVDYGRGPSKVATGPDNAVVRFMPNTPSDSRTLQVRVDGGVPLLDQVPVVQDINRMSASLMWNNLEDVRKAKSAIGSAMMVGGLVVAGSSRDREAQLAGAGVALAGLLMKATSHADTRHAEFLPQRVYVVPVNIDSRDATVTLEIPGDPGSRMVLPAIDPPQDGKVQLRYVRLNWGMPRDWAVCGRVLYGNDEYSGRVEGDTLPFILGGRDVSMPTSGTVQRYHGAGNLTDLTPTEVENLYSEEGIALSVEDAHGRSRVHILEGGDSLVPPLPGTAGYARLFGQLHPPYRARSRGLNDFVKQRNERAAENAAAKIPPDAISRGANR
jgi:hypothetical protein